VEGYIKKTYITLALLLLSFSTIPASDWSIFIYMAADNGLHTYAIEDIIEMQRGLYEGNHAMNIIVYIDHVPGYKNGWVEYIKVTPSNASTVASIILKTYPDENSGSGATLTTFLRWAFPRYASAHNILSIWSHSNGWLRGDMERWIGEDDTAEDHIGISSGELREALANSGQRYDILMLDACNTGSIEVFGEVKDYADFVIASPDLVPSRCLPWSIVLSRWVESPSSLEVSRHFCETFLDAYRMGGIYNMFGSYDQPVSMSISDMGGYNNLLRAMQAFSGVFSNPQYSPVFSNIRENIPLVYEPRRSEVDLLLFAKSVVESNAFTQQAEYDAALYFQAAVEDFVVGMYTIFSQYSQDLQSVSIFYPETHGQFSSIFLSEWHRLQFAESGWGRFLNYAYGADTRPPEAVEATSISSVVNLETLYMNWQAVVDPCPVMYVINIEGSQYVTSEARFNKKVAESGYYTIHSLDEAGNNSQSVKIDYILQTPTKTTLYVAPNPVRQVAGNFTIFYYLTKSSGFVELTIYDIAGGRVWERLINAASRGEGQELVETKLSSGVYFVVLKTEHGVTTNKFSIIK